MEHIIKRKEAEFQDFNRFQLKSRSYSNQFCRIYKIRLGSLRGRIVEKSKNKWRNHKILLIADLTKEDFKNVQCVIVGTLYKHQELKPSILKEIAEEIQAVPQPANINYSSPKDSVFLEDNVSRVKLSGNIAHESLVTGIVCSVFGIYLDNGVFMVEDLCFAGPTLGNILSRPSNKINQDSKKLLLISGLDFANQANNLGLELLSDWITGMLGDREDQKNSAQIVRLIIAGNSIRGSVETFTRKGYFKNKSKDALFTAEVHNAVHRFDNFINYIAKSCKVTIMPGEFDPSCHAIPQHPLHPHILPLSSTNKNVNGVTNPWIGKIGSKIVAGSSGQLIKDIMKVTNIEGSPLYWMEKTLTWMHYAPTAPDTLAEYPYEKTDPFIMNEYPNIYFAGNMEEYETNIVQINEDIDSESLPVRFICIPKFSKNQTAIMVDLESLDIQPICFK